MVCLALLARRGMKTCTRWNSERLISSLVVRLRRISFVAKVKKTISVLLRVCEEAWLVARPNSVTLFMHLKVSTFSKTVRSSDSLSLLIFRRQPICWSGLLDLTCKKKNKLLFCCHFGHRIFRYYRANRLGNSSNKSTKHCFWWYWYLFQRGQMCRARDRLANEAHSDTFERKCFAEKLFSAKHAFSARKRRVYSNTHFDS